MNCEKRYQLEKVFSELNRQVIDAWEQVRLEGIDGAEYRKKAAAARLLNRRSSNALRNWNSQVTEHRCLDDRAAPPTDPPSDFDWKRWGLVTLNRGPVLSHGI